MKSFAPTFLAILMFAPVGGVAQTTIWDESVHGDLGNGLAFRTNLGTLSTGSWEIMGDLDALPNFTGPDDIDTIEFTASGPWTYDLVTWTLGTATGQGFFLLDDANQTLAVTNETTPKADLFGPFPAGTYRLSVVPSGNVGTLEYTHRITVAEPSIDPTLYTFTTISPVFVDPMLAGLTSVSGSFLYQDQVTLFSTEPGTGNSVYFGWSQISALLNGSQALSIESPLGQVIVGNDTFAGTSDFFLLATDVGQNLEAFSYAGLDLQAAFLFWLEGQDGIGDFLSNQLLPAVLPPTVSGRLSLEFADSGGTSHFASFLVTVASEGRVETQKLSFGGDITSILEDDGSAIYSGAAVGNRITGEIDLVTGLGQVSDGVTNTLFTAIFSEGSFQDITNDYTLNSEDADFLNAMTGGSFNAGDTLDLVENGGESPTTTGGTFFVALTDVLLSSAFDDESPDNYPPDVNDILVSFFAIYEEDEFEEETFLVGGVSSPDQDADGVPDKLDNCPTVANEDQLDANMDGYGDACVSVTGFISDNANVGPGLELGLQSRIIGATQAGDNLSIGDRSWVIGPNLLGDNVTLGNRTILLPGTGVGDNVTLGNRVVVSPNVDIGDGVTTGDQVAIFPGSLIGNDVEIGNGIRIGVRVTIGDGAVIGDGVRIGFGATIAPGAIVPAGTRIRANSTFP